MSGISLFTLTTGSEINWGLLKSENPTFTIWLSNFGETNQVTQNRFAYIPTKSRYARKLQPYQRNIRSLAFAE